MAQTKSGFMGLLKKNTWVAVVSPIAQTNYCILSYSVLFVRQTAAFQLGEPFADEVPGYLKYDLSGLTHPLAGAAGFG